MSIERGIIKVVETVHDAYVSVVVFIIIPPVANHLFVLDDDAHGREIVTMGANAAMVMRVRRRREPEVALRFEPVERERLDRVERSVAVRRTRVDYTISFSNSSSRIRISFSDRKKKREKQGIVPYESPRGKRCRPWVRTVRTCFDRTPAPETRQTRGTSKRAFVKN